MLNTKNIRTKAFQDEECTCNCGNKHENYGGVGYETIETTAYDGNGIYLGYYRHIARCKKCGEKHTLQIPGEDWYK